MHLSQQDLLQTFPSAAVIRAVADGKVTLPSDRVERAIYQNQVFAYEEKRQEQAQETVRQPGSEPIAATGAANTMTTAPPVVAENNQANAKAAANESVMADAMALEDVASSPSITVHEQKLYRRSGLNPDCESISRSASAADGDYEAGPAARFHEGPHS